MSDKATDWTSEGKHVSTFSCVNIIVSSPKVPNGYADKSAFYSVFDGDKGAHDRSNHSPPIDTEIKN